MPLKITEQNGTFLVDGMINAITAKDFQKHFEFILSSHGELTIDIENVKEIDVNGMSALKAIYTSAFTYNKKFFIVGYGCIEIYDDFSHTDAA